MSFRVACSTFFVSCFVALPAAATVPAVTSGVAPPAHAQSATAPAARAPQGVVAFELLYDAAFEVAATVLARRQQMANLVAMCEAEAPASVPALVGPLLGWHVRNASKVEAADAIFRLMLSELRHYDAAAADAVRRGFLERVPQFDHAVDHENEARPLAETCIVLPRDIDGGRLDLDGMPKGPEYFALDEIPWPASDEPSMIGPDDALSRLLATTRRALPLGDVVPPDPAEVTPAFREAPELTRAAFDTLGAAASVRMILEWCETSDSAQEAAISGWRTRNAASVRGAKAYVQALLVQPTTADLDRARGPTPVRPQLAEVIRTVALRHRTHFHWSVSDGCGPAFATVAGGVLDATFPAGPRAAE